VPGHTLTAEVVDFPPGYKSNVHHHAGSVFAYVLTVAEFRNRTGQNLQCRRNVLRAARKRSFDR
jgi:hypothetical protein